MYMTTTSSIATWVSYIAQKLATSVFTNMFEFLIRSTCIQWLKHVKWISYLKSLYSKSILHLDTIVLTQLGS